MATATNPLSLEEYLHTSYHPDCDFVDDHLEERILGEREHARLQNIISALFYYNEKAWNVYSLVEQRIRVAPCCIRIADVCLVRRDAPKEQVTVTPPLLCVEILSPEDRLPRAAKVMEDYARMGVPHLWLLDPLDRIGYIYTGEGRLQLTAGPLTIPQRPSVWTSRPSSPRLTNNPHLLSSCETRRTRPTWRATCSHGVHSIRVRHTASWHGRARSEWMTGDQDMNKIWMRTAVLGAATLSCVYTVKAQDTSAQDKTFVAKAAEGGMAEISMSQLALKKSKNDDVKAIAQKMVDDHTKLNSDMMPFASQMGVTPPTKLNPEHQAEAARLKSMSGQNFDKEYLTALVADHHKDLGEFIAEKNTTGNPALKSTVSQATQVIRTHTEMIDQTAQKMGITVPPMPADPSSL